MSRFLWRDRETNQLFQSVETCARERLSLTRGSVEGKWLSRDSEGNVLGDDRPNAALTAIERGHRRASPKITMLLRRTLPSQWPSTIHRMNTMRRWLRRRWSSGPPAVVSPIGCAFSAQ